MKAVVADPIGGPENLRCIDVPAPEPGPNEVLIKVEYAGVNFIDVYHRTGLYKVPEKAVRLGVEAAGMVEAAGSETGFHKGERVGYCMARGSQAEYAIAPAKSVVRIPEGVSTQEAAATLLQGMTAHYLTHSTYALKNGDTCLVHAAAGGTGLLIVQMAKIAGATVIGTVGTGDKAKLAREHGADHVVLYKDEDFASVAKQVTGGRGVDVVYDSVGAATFDKSLDCLRPRGLMASFGNASGPVPPISPLVLTEKGSLFLTRPSLAAYVSDPEELRWRSSDVFSWIQSGRLRLNIFKTYPLCDVASAHRDLESRKTSGKLLLKP